MTCSPPAPRPGSATPAPRQWLLQPGDVVEVEVERLGVLRNTVVGNDSRHAAESPARTA